MRMQLALLVALPAILLTASTSRETNWLSCHHLPQVSLLARRELMGREAATLLGLHELVAYGLRGA